MLFQSVGYPKHLILPIFPNSNLPISQYYILSVETKLQGKDFEWRKRYLIKLVPCAAFAIFNKKIKFFTDTTVLIVFKKTIAIRFKLYDPDSSMTLKCVYDVSNGVAVLDPSSSDFTVFDLQVKLKDLTKGIFIFYRNGK